MLSGEDVTESELAFQPDKPSELAVTPIQHRVMLDIQEAYAANHSVNVFSLGPNTKDDFDRFIFDQDTKNEDAVRTAYEHYAVANFTEQTRHYAFDLFSRYIDYKVALATQDVDIDSYNVSPTDIVATLDKRNDIRQRFFSPNEQYHLFSEDRAVDEQALERLRIASAHELNAAQKRDAIFEQLNTLSEREKAPYQPTINMHRVAQIKALHDDETSRFNALSAEFGSEVATRFMATWAKQDEWQQRVAAFTTYQGDVMSSSKTAEEKQALMNAYLTEHFTKNETKRLAVVAVYN